MIPLPVVVNDDGHRRIHSYDGSYMISEGGVWLPGCYADETTALAAFDVADTTLSDLQRRLNRTKADPAERVITADMLRDPEGVLRNG